MRWQQSERILRDNGVAYNFTNDPQGMLRPWKLDPVPFCLDESEWVHIERSLIQRARLINLLLNDFYGPQRTLQNGLLPPELVLGHPGYLRPCYGLKLPKDIRLHLYAADLARSPDGTWWVLADRTQAPSGAGYTLENRVAMTQVFPECFRPGHLRRLASYFRSMQEMLRGLSGKAEPRVVLLTPGPYNETYVEQVFLARYLGYTLVEGSDLTVRAQKVYLKTLGGLKQVDVILRRVDDSFCDPLELWDQSLLGIPGLVEAVRCEQVAVANSLGSSLGQIPALSAFLPICCRSLLDEDLLMPSVATWWCGDAKALAYVMDNLHGLVLRPTIPLFNTQPVFGRDLTKKQQGEWGEKIKANPSHFVAQEQVELSKAPSFLDGSYQQCRLTLRVFLASDGAGGYDVLPGGLTRLFGEEDRSRVAMPLGGGSKDTWIRCFQKQNHTSLLRPGIEVEIRRGTYDLPSRVADNLFWLGRYAERTEHAARLYRSVVLELNQEQGITGMEAVLPVLHTLFYFHQFNQVSPQDFAGEALEPILTENILSAAEPGSLFSCVVRLHNVAAMVRDRISTDTWRILNQLRENLDKKGSLEQVQTGDLLYDLNRVIGSLAAFAGMSAENMTQSFGWRFLQLGRRLERVLYISHLTRRMVGASVKDTDASIQLEMLLEIFDCIITYRQKYVSLQRDAVLELIIADADNPRSLAGTLREMTEHFDQLPLGEGEGESPRNQRFIYSALKRVQRQKFTGERAKANREKLLENLAAIEEAMVECSEWIALRYFSHLQVSTAGQEDRWRRLAAESAAELESGS